MRWRRRIRLSAAELSDELPVGVEISEDDDLADRRVLVAVAARRRKAAPPACAAARAEADVRLARIAFGKPFLLGGSGVDQRQCHIGFALVDVDPASDPADGICPSVRMAKNSAERRAHSAAARILVAADDIRLEEIVRRLDLAGAHVGPLLK